MATVVPGGVWCLVVLLLLLSSNNHNIVADQQVVTDRNLDQFTYGATVTDDTLYLVPNVDWGEIQCLCE